MVLIPIKVPETESESEETISPANSLKRRLLGAAVLIALAVIVLPLLLDGSGSESKFRRVENVREYPPRIIGADGEPELPIPRPTPAEPVVAAAQEVKTGVDVKPAADPAPKAMEETDNGLLAKLMEGATEAEPEKPQIVSEQAAEVVQRRNSPSAEIDRALAKLGELPPQSTDTVDVPAPDQIAPIAGATVGDGLQSEAWVVQAGSFADQENALGLRDALRDRGFPSFVATAGDRDFTETVRFRVQVGPMADRVMAQQRQHEIERLTGRSALVRQYR